MKGDCRNAPNIETPTPEASPTCWRHQWMSFRVKVAVHPSVCYNEGKEWRPNATSNFCSSRRKKNENTLAECNMKQRVEKDERPLWTSLKEKQHQQGLYHIMLSNQRRKSFLSPTHMYIKWEKGVFRDPAFQWIGLHGIGLVKSLQEAALIER